MTADELIRAWYKEATQMRPDDLAGHFLGFAAERGWTLLPRVAVGMIGVKSAKASAP